MARDSAVKWIIGLIIYFIFIFSFFFMVDSFTQDYNLYNTLITSRGGSLDLLHGSVSCLPPRTVPYLEENRRGGIVAETSIRCRDTLGVNDSSRCTTLEGCTWDSASWWEKFWFGTGEDTCKGTISWEWLRSNDDNWGNSTYGIFVNILPRDSICDLQMLQDDAELCISMGCRLSDELSDEELSELLNPSGFFGVVDSIKNFFSMIIDVFSLRLNFGFENVMINRLLGIFIIWLPLILLILSFVVLVR